MKTDTMMDLSGVEVPESSSKIPRITHGLPFEDLSEIYKESSFGQIDFEKQYASVYFVRLEALRGAIMESARKRWVVTSQISDTQIVGHVKSYKAVEGDIVLVGILFKEMSLKPSVLEDIQNNLRISDQFMTFPSSVDMRHKISDTDVLFIEDMEARLQLVFPDRANLDSLPTGLVVAVLGRINSHGFFEVKDFTLPGCQRVESISNAITDPSYVAFVSGLQIGSPTSSPFNLQLLRDFLMGVSMNVEQRELASRISRVVIAGDSLLVSKEKDPTGSCLSEADLYLAQIASIVPVSLMSGPRDPVNYCFPQQPLHSGLLPEARRYRNLTVHTNPFKFKMGNMVLLGTSGQNVTDVMQFTDNESCIDALQLIAESRYLAPTAPDTLGCYPFSSFDPLVLNDESSAAPSVLFAGNQPHTSTRLIGDGKLRIATVADFSIRPEMLLINLNDLNDVRVLQIGSQDAF